MYQVFQRISVLVLILGVTLSAAAESGASWLRTGVANALNPNLSVIGDFVGSAGPRGDGETNRFAMREAEFAFQAVVDPYARADFFFGVHEGESPELEEGYVTLLALPGGFQARGGKFLANFGRLNMVHGHERPQVDSPFVLDAFLGEEGLNDTGIELSRVFAPLGLFTEVSYGVLNGLGSDHHHEEGETVYVQAFDENGVAIPGVFVPVGIQEEHEAEPRTARNLAHVGRVRFYKDLSDSTNLDVGFSGALHQPREAEQRAMAGVDLTFRWKPLESGKYTSFLWRTEAIHSHRELPEAVDLAGNVTEEKRSASRKGAYSYAELQTSQRWRVGLRGDYAEDPEAADEIFVLPDGSSRQVKRSVTRALSPYLTFALTEFQRFRLQYQMKHLPSGEDEHRGFFQWTVVLGPHGAHPF